MIWRVRRLVESFAGVLQKLCPHVKLRFVADAWDQEYVCDLCDKRWFNEVPKLRRRFSHNGEWFLLDGFGGVEKEVADGQ